jgi:DNA polymerase IV
MRAPATGPLPRLRADASVLHADLDAFFASVEQLDKPSLRGKPVIVGGIGGRGVVATASYEARAFGVHSAMSSVEARARCPHGAFLAPRFAAYRNASAQVMALLRELSPLVEPLSLDEAFVDLAAGEHDRAERQSLSPAAVEAIAGELKARVRQATGLTVSVGAGTSKLVAKVASDLDKPDGLRIVAPGEETALLHPLPISQLPGVGPATSARLRSIGVGTVGDLAALPESDAVGLLGRAHGRGLWLLAQGLDDRRVTPDRESKSVSVEDTFDVDIADPTRLTSIVEEMARRVVHRLRSAGLSGRTVSVKIRLQEFTTLTRSATLPAPTDDMRAVARLARQLLTEADTSGGVRLLGVGVSGLADWTQDDLFRSLSAGDPPSAAQPGDPGDAVDRATPAGPAEPRAARWLPGQDVVHADLGAGWVQGSGAGWVTVRFETRALGRPGPVRSFRVADPQLTPAPPAGPPGG